MTQMHLDQASQPEVTQAHAAAALDAGLVTLRNHLQQLQSRRLLRSSDRMTALFLLADDLHNHSRFLSGQCPETVIRDSHHRAVANLRNVFGMYVDVP